VLVREPMKAVTANAVSIELLRQRVAVCNLRMAAVKGRVETGHLRESRLPLQQSADRAEIVRLMEGCERRKSLELLDHGCVDQNRRAVIRTAMHHAVSDCHGQCSDLGAEKFDQLAQGCRHVAYFGGRPSLVDEGTAVCVLGNEVRMDADALDLALEPALQSVAGVDRE